MLAAVSVVAQRFACFLCFFLIRCVLFITSILVLIKKRLNFASQLKCSHPPTDDYNEDGSWKLVGTGAENINQDEFEDKKSKIIFSVLLERRNTFYLVSIMLPVS